MTTKKQTEDKPSDLPEQPETLPTEHTGTAPSETADGIRWGAAVYLDDGRTRLTAYYPDGVTATTDADDADAARKHLREYHQPRL